MLLGMSQEDLAECIGVTFQQVQKYEGGLNRIGAGRLLVIARALGVPVTYLLDEKAFTKWEHGGEKPGLEEILDTREGLKLAQAFMKIRDPAVRKAVLALVHAAVKGDESDPRSGGKS
jgi:transcriptional regulator with XRE-family HTH domain